MRSEQLFSHRLSARDWLASWGISTPITCFLCLIFEESHEHLLLRCPFSEQVWTLFQSHLHLSPCGFHTWSSLIAWTRLKTDSSHPIIRKFACQAAVYHLWKLRNNILHNQFFATPAAVFKDIEKKMRITITARKNRKQFANLMALWYQIIVLTLNKLYNPCVLFFFLARLQLLG